MARKLSEREMRKIERWARADKKSEIVDFFAELPRRITIPKPLLIGSTGGNDFLVHGYTFPSAVIGEIYFLDDHYTDLPFGRRITKFYTKRHERFDNIFWQARAEGMRLDPGKTCLAASLGNCAQQIVSAHAIQKSQLRKLARADGHVYGFRFGGKRDHRNFSWPEPVGLNVATTFTGVCSHHDNTLFRAIETKPFFAQHEQMFLFHYRALLFEHYRRQNFYTKLKAIYEKLHSEGLAEEFRDTAEILDANTDDVRDVALAKDAADKVFGIGNFSDLMFACWTCEAPAPIAGVISIAPMKDFLGERIQYPSKGTALKWVTLTISPIEGKTTFIIGSNSKDSISSRFIESFEAVAPSRRMQTLISYCLCCMEDLIFLPHFWESLNHTQKEAIVRTYKARYFPRKMPPLGQWTMSRSA